MSYDVNGPDAKTMIEQLQQFMERCESLLDRNIEPDLTGMDDQVEELQTTMANMKFDQLQQLQPKLQELMQKLQQLETRLRDERDQVRASVQNANQQKQAHTAYQKTQSTTPPITSDNQDEDKA